MSEETPVPEQEEKAPAGRRVWRVLGGLALVLLLAVGAGALYVAGERRALDAPLSIGPDGLEFVVAPGTSLNRVTRDLAARGVLDLSDLVYFVLLTVLGLVANTLAVERRRWR